MDVTIIWKNFSGMIFSFGITSHEYLKRLDLFIQTKLERIVNSFFSDLRNLQMKFMYKSNTNSVILKFTMDFNLFSFNFNIYYDNRSIKNKLASKICTFVFHREILKLLYLHSDFFKWTQSYHFSTHFLLNSQFKN